MAEGLPAVVILAGGLATRMRPLTETVPKAMLNVAGEPFIAHQLRLLRREGIEEVVLCLGFLGEQVAEFVGEGSRFGLRVAHSFDGEKLLGTGGALRMALPQLGESFFVMYGDSYLDIPFRPVFETFARLGRPALMTVYRNEGRFDTSNVVLMDGKVLLYSKKERRPGMHFIDYGLGLVRREVIERHPPGTAFDLAEVYSALSVAGELGGFEVTRRFYEIGSPVGLKETDDYLKGFSR